MALLTTLYLTEVTIASSIISKSPKSDGPNHLMQWMIMCQLFVFFALLEFGTVLFCKFGKKQLMKIDFTCLLVSIIAFSLFVVIFFPTII